MSFNRDVKWLLSAFLFGLLALPLLVYFTGIAVLGPYAHGGPGAFVSDFLSDLARMRWFSWSLALGPPAIVAIWRAGSRIRSTKAREFQHRGREGSMEETRRGQGRVDA
jgi:hypothetical protein